METPKPPPRSLTERIVRSLPQLARYVRRRMGPELAGKESASDIVQSTARELLRSGQYEERGEASFQRWLQTAAEHKIRNRVRYWRAVARDAGEEPIADAHDGEARPSADAMLDEERARIASAVARLSPLHQLVLRRVQMEEASYEEVARELDRSPEAVRKLFSRALARLSTMLDE